ncbi:hypothetical protein [Bradyrhizobium viridifuturi]|uniref:hypothetical protein n=1 Tax=Bradyrhizobium viridifuturi TaxID=1654716 RepID=UPI000AAE755F|nr:hypothetical protein [Bradyrhizobium viridifuturi]
MYGYDTCRSDSILLAVPVNDIIARRWPEPDAFRATSVPVSTATGEATPAARVRETFAMFNPRDARRHTMQRSL